MFRGQSAEYIGFRVRRETVELRDPQGCGSGCCRVCKLMGRMRASAKPECFRA